MAEDIVIDADGLARRAFAKVLKACASGDMKAMLHYYIIHQHKFTPSGVRAHLVQQMGCKAAENAQPAIVSQVIRLGLRIDQCIIRAASRGCCLETLEILWKKGFDVGDVGGWLDYVMLHAISAGNHRMLQFCLDEGANPNSTLRLEGHGPLILAAVKGCERTLRYLIERGAEVKGSGVFKAAARSNQCRIVLALIRSQGRAEISRRHKGSNWFPTVIESQSPLILQDELLKEDMTDAFLLATEAGHREMARLLWFYVFDPAAQDGEAPKQRGYARSIRGLKSDYRTHGSVDTQKTG